MFKRIFSAALVFGAAALAPPVMAQAVGCLPRSALTEKLETQFAEQMVGGGLENPSRLVEIWSSEETGSFTIFITQPNGISCVVAVGQNWSNAIIVPREGVAG